MQTLKATNEATKRTKERIKTHGPAFHIEDRKFGVHIFAGREMIFCRSSVTSWLGWLPLDEVEIS